ncbi:MAG: hypothetical protein KAI82_07250, partial [Tritonibacter mobilis]|nr:hypothetical protein [Tritonibacter mobilis]
FFIKNAILHRIRKVQILYHASWGRVGCSTQVMGWTADNGPAIQIEIVNKVYRRILVHTFEMTIRLGS